VKLLEELRKPRIHTALWAEVMRVGHGERQVLVEEICEDGLHFRCDRDTSLHLMPDRQRAPGALLGVRVVVGVRLPGLRRPVEVHCRLVFCRRFSQDSYRFHALFDPRDTLQHQRIRAWLEHRLEGQGVDGTSNAGVA